MYRGYDDREIGPLDAEDIEGYIEMNSQLLLLCAKEYKTKLNNHVSFI